ncbi:hypothetical protein DFH27DRAFT_42917 [Peziza echinospora]|nr:hypothetical protein DFH27DRAFT_42917 [Peziza echinospora]
MAATPGRAHHLPTAVGYCLFWHLMLPFRESGHETRESASRVTSAAVSILQPPPSTHPSCAHGPSATWPNLLLFPRFPQSQGLRCLIGQPPADTINYPPSLNNRLVDAGMTKKMPGSCNCLVQEFARTLIVQELAGGYQLFLSDFFPMFNSTSTQLYGCFSSVPLKPWIWGVVD